MESAPMLGQHANIPGNRAYCYAELAICSEVIAVTIASTYFANLQAELAWVVWLNTKTVYPKMVTHLSTNQA